MSAESIWLPYIYQYGVGGVIFIIGLIVIIRSGACNFARKQDRFWFGVLIAGFLYYAGVHLIWYWAALNVYPAGGGA
ncbi:MAG: hypothetical protein AB7N71_12580 [Phycisphaerae bacterium]